MKLRKVMPNNENSTNFDVVPDSTTEVGSTLENLKAAVQGETNASANYAAFAQAAKEQGYEQIAHLFEAGSAAEQIHIALQSAVILSMDPDYVKPESPVVQGIETDLNLIAGALGEIHETSDMYPAFIAQAVRENEPRAVQALTRAKLAESVHAELYMQAYNNIDSEDDDVFYLCPGCGYIHKGKDFEKCPICFCTKDKFRAF